MRLSDLLLPGAATFRHALESPRAGIWIGLILLVVGTLYGAWVAAFQLALGGQLQGIPVEAIPTWLLFTGNILAGVMIAIIGHLGIALIAWLMARAVDASAYLIVLYRTTAYLLPAAVLAAPWLALTGGAVVAPGADPPRLWLYGLLAALGAALFLSGLFKLYRTVQELTPTRAALATLLFLLFSAATLIALGAGQGPPAAAHATPSWSLIG
jgi:hypothetical protein